MVLRHELINLNSKEWFIFDAHISFFWYALGFLLAGTTLHYAIKLFRKSRLKVFLIPVFIIVTGIITNLGVQFLKIENTSPIILWAHYDGDINGLTLKLRKDGTYRLDDYSILGGEFFEGKFQIEKDTIYLYQKGSSGNDFVSRKLLLTPDKVLFELDENGEYETGFFSMRIVEKNY